MPPFLLQDHIATIIIILNTLVSQHDYQCHVIVAGIVTGVYITVWLPPVWHHCQHQHHSIAANIISINQHQYQHHDITTNISFMTSFPNVGIMVSLLALALQHHSIIAGIGITASLLASVS